MELLKILMACYIYTGFIFMTFTSILAIIQGNMQVFKYGLAYVLCAVLTWPYCIYAAIKD